MTKKNSALSTLFNRQKSKVKHSERKAALLRVYAQDNHILLATLIKKWLDEDQRHLDRDKTVYK